MPSTKDTTSIWSTAWPMSPVLLDTWPLLGVVDYLDYQGAR